MDYNKCAELLKAIGHPVRLRILKGLSTNTDCNVNDMVVKLGIPQSTLSQHLSVLRVQGLIAPKKKGVNVCYSIINGKILKLLEILEEEC